MNIFRPRYFKFLLNYKRTRTATRNKRAILVDLPPVTPLSDLTFSAWKEFDGMGSGKKIELYYKEEVQNILKRIIGRNPNFLKNIHMSRTSVIAEYKLVKPEKLNELNEELNQMLDRFLQPVPMYTARKSNMDITVQDAPEISGYDNCKYVFTDVSSTKNDLNRTILIRHPDGKLKLAPWEVRDRINVPALVVQMMRDILRNHTDKASLSYPIYLEQLNLRDFMELYAALKPDSLTSNSLNSEKEDSFK
ncbi:hypothetical protein MXB_444, partial [Myxobolus squamalis]